MILHSKTAKNKSQFKVSIKQSLHNSVKSKPIINLILYLYDLKNRPRQTSINFAWREQNLLNQNQ